MRPLFGLGASCFALLLAACGAPLVPPDGAASPDAHATPDAPASPDSALPDGAPPPPPDAMPPPPPDGAPPPPPDGGPATCAVPASGGTDMMAYCDLVQVALLAQDDGSARVQVRARMTFAMTDTCARIDSVELRQGATVLQTVDAGGAVYTPSDTTDPFVDAPATAPLAALCRDENARFEVVGVYVRGRRPGGTFTARCALGPSEGRYPPMTTLSCHRGLAAPPMFANAGVETFSFSGMTGTVTRLDTTVPRVEGAPAIRTLGTTVHLIPAPPPLFSGIMPLMPRDTTGWDGHVSDATLPTIGPATQLSLGAMMDLFGVDYCPPPDTSVPPMHPSPVFLARVDGTTSAGAFRTEIYVNMCGRTMPRM